MPRLTNQDNPSGKDAWEMSMTERLTRVEEGVDRLGRQSDERMEHIDRRFDELRDVMKEHKQDMDDDVGKVDTKVNALYAAVLAVVLTFGAVYLEHQLNREPEYVQETRVSSSSPSEPQ